MKQLLGMNPVPAKANEVNTLTSDNNVIIQGSNAFGTLLYMDQKAAGKDGATQLCYIP